ncbi:hypothetical protein PLICRDRAFT_156577 [Plicaturopsis crispa FD-325 SS-3]|nr:hypothetical protein PLICRDRAFT_156577 [Plicaturopsis crispa FD-325 SS-3]
MSTDSTSGGIAILGAGIFAKEAHIPALAALGSAAPPLLAVYSRSEKSARDLSSFAGSLLTLPSAPTVYYDTNGGLGALLTRKDITSVIVALPITSQPDIILRVLAAGKHVLSEKPVAPSVAEGIELIQKYERDFKGKGLIWRIAENYEAEPGYIRAAQIVRSGKIGAVVNWNCRVVNYIDEDSKYYKTPWRTKPDYQGGFLLDGGVHSAAALRTILPILPKSLSAYASLVKSYLEPHDTIHAIARSGKEGSKEAVLGIFELSFAAPSASLGTSNGITITDTQGYLFISIAKSKEPEATNCLRTRVVVRKKGSDDVKQDVEEVFEDTMQGVEAELKAFFEVVRGEEGSIKGIGEPRAALWDVAFIQAGLTSGGQSIDLDKLVDGE